MLCHSVLYSRDSTIRNVEEAVTSSQKQLGRRHE